MQEQIKKPQIIIIYNKKNVTEDLSKYVKSVTYTDYEKDQSDELEIILKDDLDFFKGSWRPVKGDKIEAKLGYFGEKLLNCGIFTVDEAEMQDMDDGSTFVIRALAASINNKVRERCTKAYDNKTLIDIARIIGKKHGFTVGGSEGFLKLSRVSQCNESDLAFLARISREYGYIFKLTDDVLTFTKIEALDSAEPLSILSKKDISNITLTDSSTKTYNACSVKYVNPKTGKLTTFTYKSNKKDVKTETLKLNVTCSSKSQAEARAKAGLRNGSKTVSGNVELKYGNPFFIAGANFTLTDYKSFNGKYHIIQSTHTVTPESYNSSGEVENAA